MDSASQIPDDKSPAQIRGRWFVGVHRYPVRCYYEDTDASGVVYHASYLRFMERARSDMLTLAGIDQHKWMTGPDRRYFAVRALAIEYLRPAFLDDDLLVVSQITEVNAASFSIQQSIWRDQVEVVSATVRGASLGEGGRPRRLVEAWKTSFEQLMAQAKAAEPPGKGPSLDGC
jgi:acyl-CoA thioester hydrolase